ncbi:response regulator [bacterium]|nr:response regulator [bacterium]
MDKQHAVDEFIANCQKRDLIKARVIMDYMTEIDPGEQRRILFELNRCDDDFSFPLLVYLSHKHPEIIKTNPHLDESLHEKASKNKGIILRQLSKKQPELKRYIELAGEIQLREALPLLRRILKETADQDLIITTVQVLGEMADSQSVDIIGEFVLSDQEGLMLPSVSALGNIASEKALQCLYTAFEKKINSDKIIEQLLFSKQGDIVIDLLNQTLLSNDAKIRNHGKSKLIFMGAKAIPSLIDNLAINNSDLQVHSLNVLMEIGDDSAVKAVRKLLNTRPDDTNVRFAAYEALTYLPPLKGDYMLATGLTDSDDSIRLAAAKAIDKNLDDVLLGGIRNMVKSENAESIRIIKAVVDSQTSDLFIRLLDLPFFKRIVSEYIALKVHADIRLHYLPLLEKKGFMELADEIAEKAKQQKPEKSKTVICAVDDSRLILSVYRRILNDLGYEPVLFQYPGECLEWLNHHQSAALFTDLNMPEITGVELAKKIREAFSADSLPIIMVTTQKEGKDDMELKDAGINKVINKPFDSETIQSVLLEMKIQG